jgi:hypothetical protein
VVAITTRVPDPLPDDHVLLPWDRQGKARSGWRRRCAAVAGWQVEIPVSDVQQVVCILPPTVIGELLTKVAAALSPPSAAPVPRPGDPVAEHPGGPPAAPPPAAEDGQEQNTSEIA